MLMENRAHPLDIIICDICDKKFKRGNRYNHKKTKYHQLYNDVLHSIKKSMVGYHNAKSLNDIIKKEYIDGKGNIHYLTDAQYKYYSSLPQNTIKLREK